MEGTVLHDQHVTLSEVRNFEEDHQSIADIENFVNNDEEGLFIMDLEMDNLYDIILEIHEKLTETNKIPPNFFQDELVSILLTDETTPQLKNVFYGEEGTNWVVLYGEHSKLKERNVIFVRLANPTNFGMKNGAEKFFFLVIGPKNQPYLKTCKETAITFSSILADDIEVRYVLETGNEDEIKEALLAALQRLGSRHRVSMNNNKTPELSREQQLLLSAFKWRFPGLGIWYDLERRFPWYIHDFKSGIDSFRALAKSLSAILFIYFACILPAIAFGLVNHIQTDGHMSVEKMIYSQAIAGTIIALFGGQPILVMLSTAPFALYIKIIYNISSQAGVAFWSLYGWVGVWNAIFLLIYSITGFSNVIKYSTRFTAETFGMFITIAFAHDGIRPTITYFINNFYLCDDDDDCERAKALVYLILAYGTAVIGFKLNRVKRSAYLNPRLREILSDYSLPIAVALMTFLGSVIFRPVDLDTFPTNDTPPFIIIYLFQSPIWVIPLGAFLGFVLSLLFYMDQNLSSAATNHPDNKLQKGPAYHLDLYVMGTLMLLFSLVGLPWVNAAIPHSPFHARILADIEVIYHPSGVVEERIVRVRETRVTNLVASILIGLSVFMVPTPLQEIPVPVLYGVFIYLSVTALPNFQFFERLKLIFTQRNLFPPSSYIRKVPLKTLHCFTLFQAICILWLVFWGLTPVDYIQIFIGAALFSIIPIRAFFGKILFSEKTLRHLDAKIIGI